MSSYDHWKTTDSEGERAETEAEARERAVLAAISAMSITDQRDAWCDWNCARTRSDSPTGLSFRDWLYERTAERIKQ